MFKARSILHSLILALLVLSLVPTSLLAAPFAAPTLQTMSMPEPVVAIHVSELTEAVWSNTAWNYFVIYESLKETLRSDGTPFEEISDADISNGVLLLPDGSPKYPIVISLATEAIHNDEVALLRNYVNAGGFLFVGSSWFRVPLRWLPPY